MIAKRIQKGILSRKKNTGIIATWLLTVLILIALAQAAQAGDWPMFGHDAAHTGVADEVVEPPLEVLWKYQTGSYVTSPAVSGGVVYVGSRDSYVYALDANTGVLKWKYQTGSYVDSSPAVSGRKMLDMDTKTISVVCPVLKRKEIDVKQWNKSQMH